MAVVNASTFFEPSSSRNSTYISICNIKLYSPNIYRTKFLYVYIHTYCPYISKYFQPQRKCRAKKSSTQKNPPHWESLGFWGWTPWWVGKAPNSDEETGRDWGIGGKDRVLGSLDRDLIHCKKDVLLSKIVKIYHVLIIYLEHRFATIVMKVFV